MTAPVLARTDHAPVLVVSGCDGATQRYRCWHALEQLQLRGIPARLIAQSSPELHDAGLGCGTVILHRVAWDPGVQRLIRDVRDAGGVALFDIDDLVFEPGDMHHHHGLALLPPDEQALYRDGVRRYRRTLLACDGALVPTDYLARRVVALGRPAFVARNVVDLELLRRSADALAARREAEARGARDGEHIVIGYASGSRTHDRDFAEAAAPAVRRLMSMRPEVVLRVIGPLDLGPEWAPLAARVQRIPALDWRALPAAIADFDISLAPLEFDNPFCHAKSELKWLEAAACGVPTVAVATAAFASAIEDGGTGFLAADQAGWERALGALLADAALRRRMGDAARRAVVDGHATPARARSFEATLAEASSVLRPDRVPPRRDAVPASRGRRRPPAAPAPAGGDCAGAAATPGWSPASARPLTVAVVMPEPPRGSGGHASIMRMVAGLDAAGHRVAVHIVPGAQMRHATERDVARFMRAHFPRSGARFRLGAQLAPSDVAIATGWTTAHAVAFAQNVATKLYFVQDFEPYFQPFGPDWLAAEATYGLGLGHITLGPWLAETLRARRGARAEPIDFGVDHAVYRPSDAADVSSAAPARALRVVFYGRASTPRRGVALGLAALGRVKAARPEVQVVLYGGEPGQRLADFPHVQAGVLAPGALAALYRSADCGLALSYTNLSFVPIEMAACGLPVVVARSEPSAWFQRDGETCLVAESTPDDLAQAVLRVLDDTALAGRLAARALAEVAPLDWARSVAQFVAHVEAYAAADQLAVQAGQPARTGPPRQRPAEVDMDALAGRPSAEHVVTGPAQDGRDALARAREIGWWLTPEHDGLHRVDLVLRSGQRPPEGLLVLSVRESPGAPEALAEANVRAGAVFDDAWTAFVFPPLAPTAGRRLWVGLRFEPSLSPAPLDGPNDERTPVAVVLDAAMPVHRSFALAPGSAWPDGFDPVLLVALQERRRGLAGLRRVGARWQRRPVLRAVVTAWAALTRPMPPVPLRPWPAEHPAGLKLLRGLVAYGPVAVAREVAAWGRWRERRAARSAADEVLR